MYCLDGVYTRMGAGDDLAADMSTFMVRHRIYLRVVRFAAWAYWLTFTGRKGEVDHLVSRVCLCAA